ncbi:hypothetical protein E2320_002288, partial [Naja naja]
MKCFRCGQQGHQALECLAFTPVPQGRVPAPPKWKKALRKPPENKFPLRSPTTNRGETLAAGVPIMQDTDSKEDDPM